MYAKYVQDHRWSMNLKVTHVVDDSEYVANIRITCPTSQILTGIFFKHICSNHLLPLTKSSN